MANALIYAWLDPVAAFLKSGAAPIMAAIIPIKCVRELPGSFTLNGFLSVWLFAGNDFVVLPACNDIVVIINTSFRVCCKVR